MCLTPKNLKSHFTEAYTSQVFIIFWIEREDVSFIETKYYYDGLYKLTWKNINIKRTSYKFQQEVISLMFFLIKIRTLNNAASLFSIYNISIFHLYWCWILIQVRKVPCAIEICFWHPFWENKQRIPRNLNSWDNSKCHIRWH